MTEKYHSPSTEKIRHSLAQRHRSEKMFKNIGLAALIVGVIALVWLFTDIFSKGYTAFLQTQIQLTVTYDKTLLTDKADADAKELYYEGKFRKLISESLYADFPEITERRDRKELRSIVSDGAQYQIRNRLVHVFEKSAAEDSGHDLVRNVQIASSAGNNADNSIVQQTNEPFYAIDEDYIGKTDEVWVTAADAIDMLHKGYYDRNDAEEDRPVTDKVISFYDKLKSEGKIRTVFNWDFFKNNDSTNPEMAGIWGAMKGSFYVLLVTLALSFPIGVAAAVYLEEYAPKNRFTDIIEVNINNLAAVPSIIFGLLGLSIFLNFFGLPRSAPVVGGLVLSLMTLPTIIISSRAALKAVPPSIKDAALGVGASKTQTISHHVLPLALPGMLTGTIIGMAQALGETAPLLMIGMVAFVLAEPMGIFDNAVVMPVQIYLWADLPARGFVAKTSGAIMVLLAFLITMNAIAVILRKRLERKW